VQSGAGRSGLLPRRDGELLGAAVGLTVASVEDGQAGQVRQYLFLTYIGVFGPAGHGLAGLMWPWLHR
jgi:hypothetical protein